MTESAGAMNKTARIVEQFSEFTGRAVSWLTLAMVLVTFVIVVLRYMFELNWIWLQESVTWMHAVVFMLGAAYTFKHDEHVRVDIFYRGMSSARRAWVNILGVVLFLLPVCGYVVWTSWNYVLRSWSVSEASREAGGLPYPFVPILKTVILIMAVLLVLQALAVLARNLVTLRTQKSRNDEYRSQSQL